jgi:hypothetical protein
MPERRQLVVNEKWDEIFKFIIIHRKIKNKLFKLKYCLVLIKLC